METLQRTANRGSISTGYDIENSCKFETDNTEYLERATGGGNGDNQKHTISVWVKRTELSNGTNTYIMGFSSGRLRFETNDIIEYQFRSGRKLETTAVYRDTSAWYHIVVVADSTLATSTDRMKLWVNGVRVTDFTTYIPQDQNQGSPLWGVYNTYNFRVGGGGSYTSDGINGYLSEVYYINGQTLDPTDFGEFDEDSGIWKPKAFTGTLGSLDNYLDFSNSSNLGEDANGGTDLSLNNITAADQATDTPTNSFCIFNPTFSWIYSGNDASATILNGGTTADNIDLSPGTAWKGAVGTMAVNKGKWYWEWENNSGAFGHRTHGILTTEFTVRSVYAADDYSNQLVFRDGGTPRIVTLIDGTVATPHLMTPYTSNNADVFGIALNMDDEEATFYRNGSAITIDGTSNTTIDISSVDGVSKYVYPLYSCYGSTEAHYNFGGFTAMGISSAASDENGYGNFEYAPPSGYYALCTKNLAEFG